jgi:hypothetical protein
MLVRKTMSIDYDKEEKEFLEELNAGKFKIDRLPNTADDYSQKEDRDLHAFTNYLNSDSFKILDTEASK